MDNCCVDKKPSGFLSGLFYGIIPHSGCILFFVFAVLGTTAISSFFRSFLLNRYSFYWLMGISLFLAVISAGIYLLKNKSFGIAGIRNNWKYLTTLFSGVVAVNMIFFLIVFPLASNYLYSSKPVNIALLSKIELSVDIPCSGHAPLVIDDLKKMSGVGDIKFSLPNVFDIYFDKSVITEKDILAAGIFKIFKAKENI